MTKPEKTIGRLVAERPALARVFDRFQIDYCCGGDRTLAAACAVAGVDPAEIDAAIEAAADLPLPPGEQSWIDRPLSELIEHIERSHHARTRQMIAQLRDQTSRVARVHGKGDPRLIEVAEIFDVLSTELLDHMGKEERILFPMCMSLERGESGFTGGELIARPISVMREDHEAAGRAVAHMRRLTDDWAPTDSSCGTYRSMLMTLAELEADLHVHVHEENEVLFPRAIALASARRQAGTR